MAEYRLTPAAERDLEAVWDYTERQWGVDQAHRHTDALTASFSELAQMPMSAPACDHIRAGYRRRSVASHVADYGTVVIRVPHGRMDAVRHL